MVCLLVSSVTQAQSSEQRNKAPHNLHMLLSAQVEVAKIPYVLSQNTKQLSLQDFLQSIAERDSEVIDDGSATPYVTSKR